MSLPEALLSAALVLVPAERHADRPWGSETTEQVTARYASLAADVATVVLDPDEAPVRGLSRVDTAALLLAMAVGETGLSEDVTRPDGCYRVGAWVTRCDRDRAVGYWQVWPDAHGLERADVQGRAGVRVALRALRSSVSKCWHLPPRYRLSAYGAGRCMQLEGAADRWETAVKTVGLVRAAMAAREEPRT